MTDPVETINMFNDSNKYGLMQGIEEDKTNTSEPEDKLPVHVIPDEGEIVRPKKIEVIIFYVPQ